MDRQLPGVQGCGIPAKKGKSKDLSDKHFSKLFFKEFVNCLLKVKTEELYKSGEYQTPAIKDGATTYVLYCTVDKTDNTLLLNLL